MLNTSSCTRHVTLPFASVTPSTPADHDFTSLYGNIYPNEGFGGGDMSMLDELFPQDFYSDLSSLESSSAGMKESAKDDRSVIDNIDQPPSSSSSSSQRDAAQFDNAASSPMTNLTKSIEDEKGPNIESGEYSTVVCNSSCDGAFESFSTTTTTTTTTTTNNNNISDTKRSPGTHSSDDPQLSDQDKRSRAGQGIPAPRGKGRPVKSAQNLSAANGCKPVIQCFTCHKTFNNSSALAKHKLIHSEDRKYSCPICSKSFKRQDHLHGHMMTHSAKKPYECCFARCDKSYCDARSLRRHHENHHFQLLESGQREFGDGKTFDPSAFKDANHWTTGFNPLDEPKPVKCSVCGKRFRNLPALNGHMRLHGGYMRQVKSEIPEASDVDKDAISESLETSCTSFSSEDASDQTALKNDHYSNFFPEAMNIKQEHSNDHYWNNNSNNNTQNWCKNDKKYLNITPMGSSCSNDSSMNQYFHQVESQDLRCELTNNACFYSTGQAIFQNDAPNANIVQAKMAPAAPHPSLSSPCLAISPPATPGHMKQRYTNASYNSKFFRRAVTPICHSNIMNPSFVPNKVQQNIHRPQNHPSNLHRTTSAVFPQGHPQSPFPTNANYTPASATTSNYFQFPSSYEDSSAMSPPTSQTHNLAYAHQYPSTSPFLNIQSRPKTPFTPNTPGRRQFYYNHGEDSPQTPSMRGYGHKAQTYHPYHSNYRYYPQLKHHGSAQNFLNVDSDFNKCLEMLEKGNIDNMAVNHSNSSNMSMCQMQQFRSKPVDDNMMDFTSSETARDMDLNCLVEEVCSSLDQIPASDWTGANQTQNNYGVMDQGIKNDLCNPVFHSSNSSFGQQDMKSCQSFNGLNNLRNNNSFKDASSSNQINHFAMNAYDYAQSQQNAFNAGAHRDTNLRQIDTLSIDESINRLSTQTNEKRKKKHKPEPLWIPANVSNFADTGGCFIDQQNDCNQSGLVNGRKKVPPPPYICITPNSAATCQGNLTNQTLPSSAPPFHDFSLDMTDSISSGLNGF